MASKLIIAPEAHADQRRIIAYISQELFNPEAATHLMANFIKQTIYLQDTPAMFPLMQETAFAAKGYRRMPIPESDYLAIYRIDEANKTVYVLRIFYARQNYATLL
ncbi:MAG: type II toxin-antitoxin system RelE/ParE family toxin [Actinomycetes bacterium]|jgi:addiction module RelE/StbE family toxin|nr:type II toxin-antitoxin system RelE/ParE family toxin [Actinomycetes bacterium]